MALNVASVASVFFMFVKFNVILGGAKIAVKPNFHKKPTFKNWPYDKFPFSALQCNRLAEDVHEVNMLRRSHGHLEQNLTGGQFSKVG